MYACFLCIYNFGAHFIFNVNVLNNKIYKNNNKINQNKIPTTNNVFACKSCDYEQTSENWEHLNILFNYTNIAVKSQGDFK